MADPLDMTGKVVIVTGGGRGVGRGIAARFLEAGAEVVICGRKAPERLPEHAGRRAHFVAADVRELEQSLAVVVFATQRFGRLDVLVNNAGGSPAADAATASPRFSEAILRLNLIAPLQFSQQANAIMQKQAGGRLDREHRERLGAASLAGDRRLRRRQGRPAVAHADARRRVGTQGARERGHRGDDRDRARKPSLWRRRGPRPGLRHGSARAARHPARRRRRVSLPCLAAGRATSAGASLLVHGGGEKPAFLDAVE